MKQRLDRSKTELGLAVKRASAADRVVALGGNPNVGKSTVFNQLTGLNQHTGNWPGKTVMNAQGACTFDGVGYVLVDLPGCYSLMAHSAEEEAARDFLCFGQADAVVILSRSAALADAAATACGNSCGDNSAWDGSVSPENESSISS